MADFKASLSGAAACAGSRRAAGRAVVGRQGQLGPGAQDRAGRGQRRGRLGPCLSAPRRRRSRQCRLLVPAGRQTGREPIPSRSNGSGSFPSCSEQEEHERGKRQTDQGRHRRLGNGDRAGSPCPGHLELKAVFRRLDRIRRRAEQPCLAGRRGDAGHAAGHQRGMRPAGGADRARPERADQSALGVRPQELFLSGLCRRATRSASTSRRSSARARSWSNWTAARPPPSASSGCIWNRTPASCCTTSSPTMSWSTSTAPAWR